MRRWWSPRKVAAKQKVALAGRTWTLWDSAGQRHCTDESKLAQICSAKARCHSGHADSSQENNSLCMGSFRAGLLIYFIFSVKTWKQELCAPLTTNHFLTTPLFDPKLALLGRALHFCAALRNKNERIWFYRHLKNTWRFWMKIFKF